MSRWWRAYDEAVDDPKLQQLRPDLFRGWFNICCITSQNGGTLPSIDAIAFKLRLTAAKASKLIEELRAADLIDTDADGKMSPHNWGGRQFQSDVSTERVKRFRNGKRNVSETANETHQRQKQSTEPEREETKRRPDGRYVFEGSVVKLNRKDFDAWTKAYPAIDLAAELTARDAWLGSERATDSDRKSWFISTPQHLANRNQEAKNRVVALKPEQRSGIPGIL